MTKVLQSSAERRIRALRRQLALDLFLRFGKCWELVSGFRSSRGLEVMVGAPLDPQVEEFVSAVSIGAQSSAWIDEPTRAAHDALIPHDCRPALNLVNPWIVFLHKLFLFDPPADRLLEYAEGPLAALSRRPTPPDSSTVTKKGRIGDSPPAMIAPPVAVTLDPQHVLDTLTYYTSAFLAELHNRLSPAGVDVWKTANEIRNDIPQLDPQFWVDQAYQLGGYICIVVRTGTTEEDVRNAFRLMRHGEGTGKTGAPRRDALTCVQCAIWYDEAGWSHERIGKHFGWAIQTPAGAKRRCETAREHIAEGRTILAQRRAAA
jgi:hypothetical protein